MALLLLLLFTISQFLLPASCSPSSKNNNYYCDWCPRHSTASLLPPASADLDDCEYGAAMAMDLNGGHAAAAGAEFFRDGAGCGACYQVREALRCRDRRVCGDGGVKVVVTGAANRTGFLLGREAFAAMARPGMADQLAAALDDDNVQVYFRRTPCEYKKNLTVQVEEGSRNPGQLGIRFLYQGGQTEIAAVEIAAQQANYHTQTASSSWRPMARRLRRAWRTPRAPAGPLRLRLVVTAGFGGKWLLAKEAVLPADWRPGQAYGTGLRVTDVALRTCARSCRARPPGDEELRR
nr:expansin-like A4 isoform X1 [Setaria viridis]